jgi:hypothetical protein
VTEPNMLHRKSALSFADRRLGDARRAAALASDTGELPDGDWWDYWQALNDASVAYESAGLGLLAGRIAFMARRVAELGARENVHAAWQKFDRLNAGGCGVA